MENSTRFSDSIHILSYMCIYKGHDLSSKAIAASVMTSPVVVRRLMSRLRKAGLIITTHGSAKPRLAKSPDKISLLEIFCAIEGDKHLLTVDHRTNPKCIVGGHIQEVLGQFYEEVEASAKGSLARLTLGDVIDEILVRHNEEGEQQ